VRIVHDHVVDALQELADESMQRRLWFSTGENGADVSSLIECRCRLFDDSGLGDALDRNEAAYTPSIDDRLRALRNALRGIDGGRSPEAVVTDPGLVPVRTMAADLLRDISART
jgi:hypothetical protein